MKKLFSVVLLLFVFIEMTSGHDQEVHQFIVRKAYQVLVDNLGYPIPKLYAHLGNSENGDGPFIPGGKIVIGAYQEDHSDVVYGNEGIIFDCNVSATHFWNADGGDASTFTSSALEVFPNAYQKALKYMYGGYKLRIPYAGSNKIEEYNAPPNLTQFYKDGIIYYRGYYDSIGQFVQRGYWTTASQETREKVFFETVGRIAHLLADMSVPAHVHNDEHAPLISGTDAYEEYMSDNYYAMDILVDFTNMAIQKGGPIYVNSVSNPLKYLFYTTNQITDYFPSDDEPGDYVSGNNDGFANYPHLLATMSSMRTAIPQRPTAISVADINEWALTTGIRATAGLLYWFAKEASLLPHIYNISFQNQLTGVSNSGTIKINNDLVNSPTQNYEVIESGTINAEAMWHRVDNIMFDFYQWEDGDASNPRTFIATENKVHTAYFNSYPETVTNLHFNSYNPRFERFITLYWDEHPNVNVTKYDIYKRLDRHDPAIKIGTVNRGITSYTDYNYTLESSVSGNLMSYGVKAYYSPDQTYSSLYMEDVYGASNAVQKIEVENIENILQPTEYELFSNYPNPFNPSTQINYQIPKDGFVNLVVYNSLGQEVEILVNQTQGVGRYSVKFDASRLPSGVYIYKLHAGEFSSVRKMILTK